MFSHFFQTIFFHRFLLAIYMCLWKKFSRVFFLIFGHNFHVFIKNVFSHFLDTLFVCFWKIFFTGFFPPIFWPRYSCVYKKRVFALFRGDFFPSLFACEICVFLEKIFLIFFPLIFWSRYSCVYKKRVFALFPDDFFLTIFG